MLLVTAAVAVFCNWYFQPQRVDEDLGNGLKLRRQVRVELGAPTPDLKLWQAPVTPNPARAPVPTYINHGNWSIFDAAGSTLVQGQFANDLPTGRWRVWHPSGEKASEGMMKQGGKIGLWRTWYEDGTKESEITYSDQPTKRMTGGTRVQAPPGGLLRNQTQGIIPVVGLATPLFSQFGGASKPVRPPVAASGLSSSGGSEYQSLLHGPAKAWHANGQPHFVGQYEDDRETGLWTIYNQQGEVTATGSYVEGKKEGLWSTFAPDCQETKTQFVRGYPQPQLEQILATLASQLRSEQPSQSIRAGEDLIQLGEPALAVLAAALQETTPRTQAVALRALLTIGQPAKEVLPKIQPLVDSPDPQVAVLARLSITILDPDARGKEFHPLMRQIAATTDLRLALDLLSQLHAADEPHQSDIFAAIVSRGATGGEEAQYQVGGAIAELSGDLLPDLQAQYASPDPKVRLVIAIATENLVFGYRWQRLRYPQHHTSPATKQVFVQQRQVLLSPAAPTTDRVQLEAFYRTMEQDTERRVREHFRPPPPAAGVGGGGGLF